MPRVGHVTRTGDGLGRVFWSKRLYFYLIFFLLREAVFKPGYLGWDDIPRWAVNALHGRPDRVLHVEREESWTVWEGWSLGECESRL